MEFGDLKLKEIQHVLRFQSRERGWRAQNRICHIVGIHLAGCGIHQFPGRKITLRENDLFFFNQREDYTVRVTEPTEAFSVHFTTYEPIETPSFSFPVKNGAPFIQLLEQLQAAAKDPAMALTAAARFYSLCAYLKAQRERLYAPRDSRLETARAYLELHFRDKDCMEQAAAQCGISRRWFTNRFCAAYQVTPGRWLTLRKVQYAKSLLEIDGVSITDVAAYSGFSDIYYFSKVFKKETGLTPTQYQKKCRAENR